MTSVQSGISIHDPRVKEIDTSKLRPIKVYEADEALYQRMMNARESFLEARYTTPSDTAQHPFYKTYATVEVNGKVVATITNNGSVSSSNSVGGRISGNIPNEVNGQNGPLLAEARAEKIAELLGGKVVKSANTMTQSEYRLIPQPQVTVDYEAMMKDPAYEQIQQTKKARTIFLAQELGEAPVNSYYSGTVEEYMDFVSKTPEERFFEFMLAEEGLTREALEALPPEEQTKIEEKIIAKMKENLGVLSYAMREPPVVSNGVASLDVVNDLNTVMMNTSHGDDTQINLDEYFTPRSERGAPVGLMSIPILFPTKENIDILSSHASSKLKGLMEEYSIPMAPDEINYDRNGRMVLPVDYAHADEFRQMMEENESMARELSTINALTSHYVGMQQAAPFREEMAGAISQSERELIVDKYRHLFSGKRDYADIALRLSGDGWITPLADEEAV